MAAPAVPFDGLSAEITGRSPADTGAVGLGVVVVTPAEGIDPSGALPRTRWSGAVRLCRAVSP